MQYAAELRRLSRELRGVSADLRGLNLWGNRIANLPIKGDVRWLAMAGLSVGRGNLSTQISGYTRATQRYAELAQGLASRLTQAAGIFDNAERGIMRSGMNVGREPGEGSPGIGFGYYHIDWLSDKFPMLIGWKGGANEAARDLIEQTGATSKRTPWNWHWESLLPKILGGGAIGSGFGGLVSGAWPLILGKGAGDTGGTLAKLGSVAANWIKARAAYADSLKTGAKVLDANKALDKTLLGLDRYLKNGAKGWGNFGQNFSEGFNKTAGSAGNWVANGIKSIISNHKEFDSGAITADRAVVETVWETAVGVGLTALGTAAAGAALAAAGVVSAPAVAVAAAGGLLVWGADTIWKNTVGEGKGIVETGGKLVGETYDITKKAVGTAAKWAGDRIQDGAKALSKAADSAKKWASDTAGAVMSGAKNVFAGWNRLVFG